MKTWCLAIDPVLIVLSKIQINITEWYMEQRVQRGKIEI